MMPRGVPNNLFAIYYFTFTHSLNLPLPPPPPPVFGCHLRCFYYQGIIFVLQLHPLFLIQSQYSE
jgi:hypothetical protein